MVDLDPQAAPDLTAPTILPPLEAAILAKAVIKEVTKAAILAAPTVTVTELAVEITRLRAQIFSPSSASMESSL